MGILNQKKEEKIKRADTINPEIYSRIIFEDKKTKDEFMNIIKYSDDEKKIVQQARIFTDELKKETIKKINSFIKTLKEDKNIDFEGLKDEIVSLSEKVNFYNSIEVSSYIMYRKYILNLFNESLSFYKNNTSQNENLFHNMFFLKKSKSSKNSNMWLFDEMYLYFDGASEERIEDIQINGENIIREDLTEEEKRQLNKFNQKRLQKRIDLLFFPEESKCIIIELKDPKGGLNENVLQMDKYAELIANFVKDKFRIEQFYTYLITDNFDKYDKPTSLNYRKIYGINGYVRQSIDIKNFNNDEPIANQYSEVITYTDIYERALKRNEIFCNKLLHNF
jgi:hypothetical protein